VILSTLIILIPIRSHWPGNFAKFEPFSIP
jgi:hypothetical protein